MDSEGRFQFGDADFVVEDPGALCKDLTVISTEPWRGRAQATTLSSRTVTGSPPLIGSFRMRKTPSFRSE